MTDARSPALRGARTRRPRRAGGALSLPPLCLSIYLSLSLSLSLFLPIYIYICM